MQDLEGHGEDFELYPKSKGKALSDFEQRNVPVGVWRTMRRSVENNKKA